MPRAPTRVLLVYPRFPSTFWSFEEVLRLVGRKALMPPLGLVTVAAMLPPAWELRLVDCNVRPVTEDDWAWADVVMLSAMIAQRESLADLLRDARRRGKTTVVGGPYPTALPEESRAAGADFLVLDEAELTVPAFLDAFARGDCGGTFTAGGVKPDVTSSPVPRFDLLDRDAYDAMAVQCSRGCPYRCEFCDIIVLYGRVPRTKTPAQVTAELDALYALGWRRGVFLTDDNFIGDRRRTRELLLAIDAWQTAHGHPFSFDTQATVDLATDPELVQLMVRCRFAMVFLGIETTDIKTLTRTLKLQNTRIDTSQAVEVLTRAGLRVAAGFIIGFDGESAGVGDRIIAFMERTAVPTTTLTILHALPGTALWTRVEQEGRLVPGEANINQTVLMNFEPTRPLDDIAREYAETFYTLYDPVRYLDRVYRYFLKFGIDQPAEADGAGRQHLRGSWSEIEWVAVRALAVVAWRQGVRRTTRWKFWHHLASILLRNPRVVEHYLAICAHNEHWLWYRESVRTEIAKQLSARRATATAVPAPALRT